MLYQRSTDYSSYFKSNDGMIKRINLETFLCAKEAYLLEFNNKIALWHQRIGVSSKPKDVAHALRACAKWLCYLVNRIEKEVVLNPNSPTIYECLDELYETFLTMNISYYCV